MPFRPSSWTNRQLPEGIDLLRNACPLPRMSTLVPRTIYAETHDTIRYHAAYDSQRYENSSVVFRACRKLLPRSAYLQDRRPNCVPYRGMSNRYRADAVMWYPTRLCDHVFCLPLSPWEISTLPEDISTEVSSMPFARSSTPMLGEHRGETVNYVGNLYPGMNRTVSSSSQLPK